MIQFRAHFTLWMAILDAAGPVYAFVCTSEEEDGTPCGAESPAGTLYSGARAWTVEHITEHPEHRSYAEVYVQPYALVPDTEPWPGPVGLAHTTCTPPTEEVDGG